MNDNSKPVEEIDPRDFPEWFTVSGCGVLVHGPGPRLVHDSAWEPWPESPPRGSFSELEARIQLLTTNRPLA
jgi:hypothetical protein